MPYINKEKYGQTPWIKLEKAANKELFLRDPPPVNKNFDTWFSKKFPGIETKLVKTLIYRTIVNSAKNEQTPLACMYLQKLLNLSGSTELKVKDVIIQLSNAFNVNYNEYNHSQNYARNIQIDQELAESLLKDWNSFLVKKSDSDYQDAVSPITNESIHSSYYVKVITESKTCIKNHTEEKYKKEEHPLTKIVKYLDSRKIPQIVFDRLDQLIDSADQSDFIRYNRLCAVKNNLIGGNVWRINDQSYRVFMEGESLTTLRKEDRWSVMRQEDGFYEIDLTNAHFAILASLINGVEMNKMLDNGSIWNQLLTYLNIDVSFKDSLKQCVCSMIYGSAQKMQQILLIQNEKLREELKQIRFNLNDKELSAKTSEEKQSVRIAKNELNKRIENESTEEDKNIFKKLLNHPAIKELLDGTKKMEKEISDRGSFGDAFGHINYVKDFNGFGKIRNTILTSYEKKMLMPIYKDALNTRYFQVIIDQHDGVTLDFSKNIKGSPEVRENILKSLTEKVNQNIKEMNIKSIMVVKGA